MRMAYDLYLKGYQGCDMGGKEIAKHLTEKGLLMRGKPWNIHKTHKLLSDPLYMGEHFTNWTTHTLADTVIV